MTAREQIEAALAEAQARLDAATPGPLAVTTWSPSSLMPALWAADTLPPIERGPFAVIHAAGDRAEYDAALIVAAVNREQRAIDHATDVLARHGERPLGYIGICARCREPEPCPEIASLHTLWVVP